MNFCRSCTLINKGIQKHRVSERKFQNVHLQFISQVTVIPPNKIIKNMQAAGSAAKQINVIVCSHICWQGACLFAEEKVSCLWEEGVGVAVGVHSFHHMTLCYSHLVTQLRQTANWQTTFLSHPARGVPQLYKKQRKLMSSDKQH